MAAALAVLFKSRIEMFFATSIIGLSIITYLFARLELADIGIIVSVLVCCTSIGYLVKKIVVDKEQIAASVITPGAVTFLFFCFAFYLFCIGHDASGSPDSMYWVRIAKGIYYDKTYWYEFNNTSHPQFITIWAYLSMKTWIRWSDAVLIASNNILLISYLMPLFAILNESIEKTDVKNKEYYLKNVLLALCVFFLPYVSDGGEYAIYASDMIMALALGMGIVIFLKAIESGEKINYYISLSYFVSAVATKRIAIVIVAILFIWMAYILLERHEYRIIVLYIAALPLIYLFIKGLSVYPLAMVGSIFCALLLFNIKKKRTAIWETILMCATAILIGGLYYYIIHRCLMENEKLTIVVESFFKMLISNRADWYYVGEFIKLPISVFLLLNVILFAVLKLCNIITFSTYETIAFGGLFISIVVYIFLLLFLYVTDIADASGPTYYGSLLGLSRYMKLTPILLICYWLYVLARYVNMRVLSLALIVLILLSKTMLLTKFLLINDEKLPFGELEQAGIQLDHDQNIGFIDMGAVNHYRQFYLNLFYKVGIKNVDELSFTYRRSVGMTYISEAELRLLLDGCDYLYIYSADDSFSELYKGLFEDCDNINTEEAMYIYDTNTLKYKELPLY